jgi:hypothetical protein
VFRLIVSYMFWKSSRETVDLRGIPGAGIDELRMNGGDAVERTARSIIEQAERLPSEDERVHLAGKLGERLGVDYHQLARDRTYCLMSPAELRELVAAGFDLQLHTHRHRMPDDRAALIREIEDNRTALRNVTGADAHHLCYPSGVWSREHWPWLREAGVESGVTCDPGLNEPNAEMLGLKRFLDGETVSAIEFEAEISGFTELLRRALRRN